MWIIVHLRRGVKGDLFSRAQVDHLPPGRVPEGSDGTQAADRRCSPVGPDSGNAAQHCSGRQAGRAGDGESLASLGNLDAYWLGRCRFERYWEGDGSSWGLREGYMAAAMPPRNPLRQRHRPRRSSYPAQATRAPHGHSRQHGGSSRTGVTRPRGSTG
jgi:hypothetical protein